jgi:hypothetical protein
VAHWEERTIKLPDDHGWKATPGYNVFVADRGAVQFEFPETWLVKPQKTSVGFHDAEPPDDNCVLEITVTYLSDEVDWRGLPIRRLVHELRSHDDRNLLHQGEVVDADRADLELSWFGSRWIDPQDCRAVEGRLALARRGLVQLLLTYDYWVDDSEWAAPIWDAVLGSLRMGENIADPLRGPAGP